MKEIRLVRLSGLLEGVSLLALLFVAMPLKYAAGMPMAVRIVGSLHGGLFLWFLLCLLQAHVELRPRLSTSLLLLGSAVVPFGFLILRKHAARLDPAASQAE